MEIYSNTNVFGNGLIKIEDEILPYKTIPTAATFVRFSDSAPDDTSDPFVASISKENITVKQKILLVELINQDKLLSLDSNPNKHFKITECDLDFEIEGIN